MSFRTRTCSAGLLAAVGCMTLIGCAPQSVGTGARNAASAPPSSTCDQPLPLLLGEGRPDATPPRAIAAFITDETAPKLVVHDALAQRELFRVPSKAQSRPQILRDLVVTTEDDHMVAFDLHEGTRRFSVALDRPVWLGAAQARGRLLLATTSPSYDPLTRGSTITAVDATSGKRLWRRDFRQALGRPVLAADRAYLLAEQHELRVLDARTGADLGCSRLPGGVSHWLALQGSGLFYGAREVRSAGSTAAGYPLPELPGRPEPLESSFEVAPASRSAHGRVAASLRPTLGDGGRVRPHDDRYYYVFYRALFAFHGDGTIAWAHGLAQDAVRISATQGGVTVVTQDGAWSLFSAQDGTRVAHTSLGAAVASADLRVDGAAFGMSGASGELRDHEPAPGLRGALSTIASDPDTRLLPARLLAVDLLAQQPDALATDALLALHRDEAVPEELRARVAEHLRARRTGLEPLVAALDEHYDFLDARAAPPLDVLVPVVVAQRNVDAIDALIAHLFAPATPHEHLRLLVDALATLGGERSLRALAELLSRYHADSSFAANPSALIAAATVLANTPAAPAQVERGLLARVARDPSSLPELAHAAYALLPGNALANVSAPAPARLAQAESAPALTAPAAPAAPSRGLTAHEADLRSCLRAEHAKNEKLTQVRVAFVVQRDGRLDHIQITPHSASLSRCLVPKLQALRVSASEHGRRQLGAHSISLASTGSTTRAVADVQTNRPHVRREFWALSEAQAQPTRKALEGTPWWVDRNPLFISVEPARDASAIPAQVPPVGAQPPATSLGSSAAPSAERTNTPAPPPPTAEEAWWLPATAP